MASKVQDLFGKIRQKAKTSPFKKPKSSQRSENDEETDSSGNGFSQMSVDGPVVVRRFEDLFTDSSAMSYFMRYLDRKGRLNHLRFWIHVEGFKTAGESQDPENLRTVECFNIAQRYVWNRLKEHDFEAFQRSPFYILHQVEVFKTGLVDLDDILNDDSILKLFIQFLEAEQRRCLIDFVLAVQGFDAEYEDRPASSQPRAMLVYERFISMQALEPLDFDPWVRVDVESKICTESGVTQQFPFEKARQAAQAVLNTNFIPRFMKTDSFRGHIDNLNRSLPLYVHMEDGERRRSDTVLGREVRRVRQSKPPRPETGLAADGPRPKPARDGDVKERSASTSSAANDEDGSSQCSDRSLEKKNGAALGLIDPLGRYQSLFDTSPYEHEDTIHGSSKLKGVLNKYLKPSSAQENERACEMARLIVDDVKNMVLNAQAHKYCDNGEQKQS